MAGAAPKPGRLVRSSVTRGFGVAVVAEPFPAAVPVGTGVAVAVAFAVPFGATVVTAVVGEGDDRVVGVGLGVGVGVCSPENTVPDAGSTKKDWVWPVPSESVARTTTFVRPSAVASVSSSGTDSRTSPL